MYFYFVFIAILFSYLSTCTTNMLTNKTQTKSISKTHRWRCNKFPMLYIIAIYFYFLSTLSASHKQMPGLRRIYKCTH